ncbi:electron transfer flavoprotein subunit alpha/FixB family protein [Thermodesulfobacteriota bacterium]
MNSQKNVMVYTESIDGELAPISKELLGCGRRLANELEEELCAVLIGDGISHLADDVTAFGADKVYIVDDPLLKDFRTDSYLSCMEKVVEKEVPRILILGQTSIGQDLSPRLAFRLTTTIVPDCVELSIEPELKLLLRTKPVYGGKAMAIFRDESYPQMATIRSKSMSPSERDDSREGSVVIIDADLDESLIRTRVLEKVTEEKEGISLEDAQIIIAGGRGLGSAEGFKKLEELAEILEGAAVGASRPPCDEGWVPATIQVGLSGKIVAPKVYIAVGVSGASQHMAGCAGAGTIVAINKDSNAQIYKFATFGVTGDWNKILPPFIEKIKEL